MLNDGVLKDWICNIRDSIKKSSL